MSKNFELMQQTGRGPTVASDQVAQKPFSAGPSPMAMATAIATEREPG